MSMLSGSDVVNVTYGGRTIPMRVKSVTEYEPGKFDVTFEEVLDDTPTEVGA